MMTVALTRAALRDELDAQQEVFQRAVVDLGAQLRRDVREELRRGASGWEDETPRAARSSWGPGPHATALRQSLSGAPARCSMGGPKDGAPVVAAAEGVQDVTDVLPDASPAEVDSTVQEVLCLGARQEEADARPAAAGPAKLASLGWVAPSPIASPRQRSQEPVSPLQVPQLLPGQAEEPRTPSSHVGGHGGVAASRRVSTFSMRNSNTTTLSMSEGWGETFPNDLRLPTLLRKSTRARDARRCSVTSRRNSAGSNSSGATSLSKAFQESAGPESPASTSILPVTVGSRRPSFLSTRIGMEDAVLNEQDAFKRIVYHPFFDITVVALIMLNGFMIGVQTDIMARSVSEEVPLALRVMEVCFCAAFTVELLLRFLVERLEFLRGPEWAWNVFDLLVVLLQLTEEALAVVASATGTESHAGAANFGFVRMLRALRLIRIIRLVRVLRLIGELRTIVLSIASSMKHLFWTLVLLLLMIYIFSVPLTQIVLDHRLGNADADLSELILCWNSIGRSSLTLFEAIFGGIDWDIAVMPLVSYIHLVLAPMFCLYIAFALLALMNVVTGVFVESAIDSANRDKEKYLVQIARELFEKADPHNTGVITWAEFEKQLENPELQQYFKGLGVDAVSAKSLFRILDLDNSGAIDADELLTGTLRLRGDAKAIDLAALIYESRRMSRRFQAHASSMDDALAQLGSLIGQIQPGGEVRWEGKAFSRTPRSAA